MLTSRRMSLAFAVVMASSLLLVSSALAGQPSAVTVRVVGLTGTTLLPQTQVTTSSVPIDPDGNPLDTCTGTSAAGALDDAIRGNWVVLYENSTLGYQIDGIQGLNFPAFSSNPDAYWSFWMNDAPEEIGACGQELSPGDNIVFFAQCDALGTDCPTSADSPQHFLTETAPASGSVQVDTPVEVTVGSLSTESGAKESLPSGAIVSTGSISATPNAQGVATLTFPSVGTYTIEATAPDSVPSDPQTVCVHNGNDGNCGTQPVLLYACADSAPAPSCPLLPGIPPAPGPYRAVARGVKAGHVYPRHGGPRILRGLVQVPTGSTLRDVRISLLRRTGKRCFAFNGITETFVRDRCGTTRFFSVGGSESFSYLLPSSLPKGSYVYDIEAINDAGQATKLVPSVSHVVFHVK